MICSWYTGNVTTGGTTSDRLEVGGAFRCRERERDVGTEKEMREKNISERERKMRERKEVGTERERGEREKKKKMRERY